MKQGVWPPGSADTVCPRLPVMTQVQHFVSRIKKRQRWDVQTMSACDFDLWPWNWCAMSHVSWSTLLPILAIRFGYLTIRFRFMGYWALRALGKRSEASSLLIDRPAANCCCLHGRNWKITVFRRQNSRFRKQFSKIGLSDSPSLEYCMRVWCKLIRKWSRNTPTSSMR